MFDATVLMNVFGLIIGLAQQRHSDTCIHDTSTLFFEQSAFRFLRHEDTYIFNHTASTSMVVGVSSERRVPSLVVVLHVAHRPQICLGRL